MSEGCDNLYRSFFFGGRVRKEGALRSALEFTAPLANNFLPAVWLLRFTQPSLPSVNTRDGVSGLGVVPA